MNEQNSNHCIVIGAGTVGASCAWHLQRSGCQVTVIDPEPPGQACSYGNAACISPSAVVPFSYPGMARKLPGWLLDPLGPVRIRPRDFPTLLPWFWRFWRAGRMEKVREIAQSQALLMHPVFADFDEMLQAVGIADLKIPRGAIHIWDNEKQHRADLWQADLFTALGFSMRRLGADEVKAMVPCLRLDGGVAVLMPEWHHVLDPGLMTQRIAEHCFANGGDWVQDRVRQINTIPSGVNLVTESGRKLQAGKLVIAAGAWSNTLAAQVDFPVSMVAKRGYHSMIPEPGIELDYPVLSVDHHFVMTPMSGGLRLAGTAEFAALEAEPDYRRAKVLLKQAQRYLDGLQTENVSEWMGPRPMTSDSMPVISPSPACPDVFYAFGHGHFGLTQGPTTGRIIAEMITGRPGHSRLSSDLSAFHIARFKK